MNIALLPVVKTVDTPTIRQRVPLQARDLVFAAIETAMRTLPLNPEKRVPLRDNLQGPYKCRFPSGLVSGNEDMRLAVYLDAETDTAVIWAIGFRDAYQPTDFYRLLRQRIQVEKDLGNPIALVVGKPVRRRRTP